MCTTRLLAVTVALLATASAVQAAAPPGRTFLYAWAGPDRPSPYNRDFLATIDATLPASPVVTHTTDIPTWSNEPHHMGFSSSAQEVLAAGGLFSYRANPTKLKFGATPDIYFFDTSNNDTFGTDASKPKFTGCSLQGTQGAVVDSFLCLPTTPSRCLVTMMGNRQGGGSGRMALITRNTTKPAAEQWRITGEYPGGVSGAEDEKFNPHGFDRNGNTMVTADYIVVSSTWDRLFGLIRARPTYRTTVRVWDIAAVLNGNGPPVVKSVWSVDDLPPGPSGSNSEGLMTVRYTGKDQLFYFSAGKGSMWMIDASKPAGTPTADVIKKVYAINPAGDLSGSCVFSQIKSVPAAGSTPAYARMILTALALDEVQVLDVTDRAAPVLLSKYKLPTGAQPHVVVVDSAWSRVAVSTYYLQQSKMTYGDSGYWTNGGEKAVHFFTIGAGAAGPLSELTWQSKVNFATIFADTRGVTRPHGLAFKTIA